MLPRALKQAFNLATAPRTKLALVVRADLKISKGKTAAQCAHAAILCYQQSQTNVTKQQLIDSWSLLGQPKIVLRVNTYDEMLHLQREAEAVGVVAAMVRDEGRTQLEPGTATVLGLGPDTVEHIDKLVANLKLL